VIPDGSFARLLGPIGLLRYAWWRLRGRRSTLHVALRGGPRIRLRPRSAGNNDYGVAYEVFVHRHYACPRPVPTDSVRLVVDLGANVGFSCLHWLMRYPQAKVIALEPHPDHFAQCRANISANDLSSRVEMFQAAAGVADRSITLSDAGTSSTVLPENGAGIIARMIDVFSVLSGRTVDILKMDIEGGEYAILSDPRFALLRPRCLVMEWHGTGTDRDWCFARLAELEYDTVALFDKGSCGMLWAFQRTEMNSSHVL
jgi:FkbM family methyltransferase